jgi:hypothetical protein
MIQNLTQPGINIFAKTRGGQCDKKVVEGLGPVLILPNPIFTILHIFVKFLTNMCKISYKYVKISYKFVKNESYQIY